MNRSLVVLSLAVFLSGFSPQAKADGLLANWKLNEPAGSTSFADSSGHGNTGSLVGTDSLTTIAGPFGTSGPTALYFHGATGNTTVNGADYINVPYNSALSGMGDLTLSAWIYLPAGTTNSSPPSEIFSYMQSGSTGTNAYMLGTGYTVKDRMYFNVGYTAAGANDMYYWTGGTISGVTVPTQAAPARGSWSLPSTMAETTLPPKAIPFFTSTE